MKVVSTVDCFFVLTPAAFLDFVFSQGFTLYPFRKIAICQKAINTLLQEVNSTPS